MVTQGMVVSGRYLVSEELGAGGMGTVFRAVDLRTGGTVAVKVPHPFLAHDQQYIARLRREAEIAASLHSPRVVRVTDVGEVEGTPYLVMEYALGESLAERLGRDGAMSVTEALHVAIEVARALEAAHAGGIVHRDLKPHNILIHRDEVKVLDFGIAAVEGLRGLTTAGTFVGTPEYLAPERADGTGDIRSDIYSLGVVLYEMLTGQVPFGGGTPWRVVQLHATAPPPPLVPTFPPCISGLVDRCLAKRPDDRFQTPSDLIAALTDTLRESQEHWIAASDDVTAAISTTVAFDLPPVELDEGHVRSRRLYLQAIMARLRRIEVQASILLLAAIVIAVRIQGDGKPAESSPRVATIMPTPDVPTPAAHGSTNAEGTSGGMNMPDDTATKNEDASVSFRAPLNGAEVASPVELVVEATGVSEHADGNADEMAARHLHYFVDTDPSAVLVPGQPLPLGDQHIVRSAALRQLLDLKPGAHTVWAVVTDKDHVPLSQAVQAKVSFTVSGTQPVAGKHARVIYQSLVEGRWRLFVSDGSGQQVRRLTTGSWDDIEPAWSPDGSRIAFVSNREGRFHLYVMNADGTGLQQLTRGNFDNRAPSWAANGAELAFSSDRDGGREHIFVLQVRTSETRKLVVGAQPAWSPVGHQIAFMREQGGISHLFTVDATGGEPRQLTMTGRRHIDPAWSSDGKRIAFSAYHEGRWNVFVMNADGSGVRQVTNTDMNRQPAWSPDGREVAFVSGREGQFQVFAMPMEGGELRRLTEGLAHNLRPSWPRK